ncbi:MAG: hydrophobic protein, partial [Actinobacteria bacterium]|nr:hydrophobic protein [Actinomycetota bacterium]
MLILFVLLIVILLAGVGFSLHLLWIVAAVFFVLWLAGLVLGRGANAGRHRF